MLFKVREKGAVREGEKARCIVCHTIGRAVDVVINREVAVVALVHAIHSEEVGSGCIRGNGPFDTAHEGGIVVVQQGDGCMLKGDVLCEDVLVSDDPGQFQVGVSDAAGQVIGGDEGAADVGRKIVSPDKVTTIREEPDAAHAG
jgi:hypothetical protein